MNQENSKRELMTQDERFIVIDIRLKLPRLLEAVAELFFVTLNAVKCLNFIKDKILLRRSPLDIPLRFIQNDNSDLYSTDFKSWKKRSTEIDGL